MQLASNCHKRSTNRMRQFGHLMIIMVRGPLTTFENVVLWETSIGDSVLSQSDLVNTPVSAQSPGGQDNLEFLGITFDGLDLSAEHLVLLIYVLRILRNVDATLKRYGSLCCLQSFNFSRKVKFSVWFYSIEKIRIHGFLSFYLSVVSRKVMFPVCLLLK